MAEFSTLSLSLSLSNRSSIVAKIKEGYLIWLKIIPHMARSSRYTLGTRIENIFLDLLELSYIAYFTEKEGKKEKIGKCILTLDTLKYLISIAWEGGAISNNQFKEISYKLDEAGKMLGGWMNFVDKKLPPKTGE